MSNPLVMWAASAALRRMMARWRRHKLGDRKLCVLCAAKHLAQARALLLELRKGYPEHYWFALGHIAEAEDELVLGHEDLANEIRAHRKELELYPKYEFPFKDLILRVALVGGYDVDAIMEDAR